jgi:small subunit ribosomal protein S17
MTQSGAEKRNRRRVLQGVVTSDAMNKTITIQVERLQKHPKYHKYIRRHTKYHVHDEQNDANIGDQVEIAECRPMSKLKRWRLIKVLGRSAMAGGVS